MKAGVIRKLAEQHDLATLEAAADALENERAPEIEIRGDDEGEQLTHCLLAQRLRARIDAGDDPKAAFRELMGEVRSVIAND